MKITFKIIIKRFRSSIFAEYLPMVFVVVAIFTLAYFTFDKKYTDDDDFATSQILENKTFSEDSEDIDYTGIAKAIKELEAQEPPRITGNETLKELYNNPYIKHIRTALNGYLDGSNAGAEEVVALGVDVSSGCGLSDSDKTYYKNKFFVYEAADNDYGGVQAYIVFVDKPDTIFWAWVYRLGGDGEYSLRGFCKTGPPDELRDKFVETMTTLIEQGEIKFVL